MLRTRTRTASTVMSSYTFYSNILKQSPLLARAKTLELHQKYKSSGDIKSLQQLIRSNLRLVVSVLGRLKVKPQWWPDLVSVGNLGLIEGIDRWDPEQGTLANYAWSWILRAMMTHLRDNSHIIRFTRGRQEEKIYYNMNKIMAQRNIMGLESAIEDLAKVMEVEPEKIAEMSGYLSSTGWSLNAPLPKEINKTERLTWDDILQDPGHTDEEAASNEISKKVRDGLNIFAKLLDERDQDILFSRIANEDPETLESIGIRYGITKQGIRIREQNIKIALGKYLTKLGLNDQN